MNTANTANTVIVANVADSAAILSAFETTTPLYSLLIESLGDFRAVTLTPATICQTALTLAAAADAKLPALNLAALAAAVTVAVAGVGLTTLGAIASGDFDLPQALPDGHVISLVNVRGIKGVDKDGKEALKNGAVGLAIYPHFTVETLQESESGRAYLAKLVTKEAGLVAFRPIRSEPGVTTYGELADGALRMPLTVADYTDSTRGGSAESFAAFNLNFEMFRNNCLKNPQQAAAIKALPAAKSEILKAMRSAPYAAQTYPRLESIGLFAKVGRQFANVLAVMAEHIAASGEPVSFDPSAVTRWLDGRETLDLRAKAGGDVELDSLDLSAFD